jgi:hypothetical protein
MLMYKETAEFTGSAILKYDCVATRTGRAGVLLRIACSEWKATDETGR